MINAWKMGNLISENLKLLVSKFNDKILISNVSCTQGCIWIYGRYAPEKRVTAKAFKATDISFTGMVFVLKEDEKTPS